MNKTAIIFDVDGVLIQSRPFTLALEEQHQISRAMMGPFFQQQFQGCLVGTSDLKQELEAFLPGIPWTGGVEAFLDFWFHAENHPDRVLLAEISCLRERAYFVGVATNQERYRVQFMRDNMAFGLAFDQIFASCDIGYKKPEAEFFRAVTEDLQDHGIGKIVYFDDRADNVEGAQQAGWDSRLYASIADFRSWAERAANQAEHPSPKG